MTNRRGNEGTNSGDTIPRYAFAMHVTEQNEDPRMSEYKPVIYMYIALIPTYKP